MGTERSATVLVSLATSSARATRIEAAALSGVEAKTGRNS